jgi:hypothetical protein
MIRPLEGFTFASAFYLNMDNYHIKIDVDFQKQCTIVFPWGKYKYKRSPMDIKIAWFLMFFKTLCLSLSKIWNMLRQSYYLDDLSILTNSSFKDHLLKSEMRYGSSKTLNRWDESEHFQISVLCRTNRIPGILDTGSPDKAFNLYVTRLR